MLLLFGKKLIHLAIQQRDFQKITTIFLFILNHLNGFQAGFHVQRKLIQFIQTLMMTQEVTGYQETLTLTNRIPEESTPWLDQQAENFLPHRVDTGVYLKKNCVNSIHKVEYGGDQTKMHDQV